MSEQRQSSSSSFNVRRWALGVGRLNSNAEPRTRFTRRGHRRGHRQGAIFIVALGVIVILTSVVLVMVQSMRTEATASANRLSMSEADAVEQAAEMWVLGQVDTNTTDAVTITTTPAEQIQVGKGYFWLISPDPTQDQTLNYGITDEASKMNINANWAVIPEQLSLLPGMTQEIADNITAWAAVVSDPSGATTDYYQSLPEPYTAKGAPFETVEELLLIEDMTPQVLYGEDLNQNGILDASEQNPNSGGITLSIGNGADTRGLINYVTCYSATPTTTATGSAPFNIDTISAAGTGLTRLQTILANSLSSSRATAIVNQLQSRLNPRSPAPVRWDLGQFYGYSGMTPQEFGQVFDSLTSAPPNTGLINVNTAPAQVLACLPGLAQGESDTIVASRTSADLTNMGWFFKAISPTEIASVAPYITDRSSVYSADIVAVSGDGRAFKRERIVVKYTSGNTPPSTIIYRKDMTSLGWPLTADIRQELRSGHGLPNIVATNN
jgi:type II secretory pathway component PulK